MQALEDARSPGYVQPDLDDNVFRHMTLTFIVPRSMLAFGMRRWGNLDKEQSTSARFMNTVEHFVQLALRYCLKRVSKDLDNASSPFFCETFHWSRADHDNVYSYDLHMPSIAIKSEHARVSFVSLMQALIMRLNSRWVFSANQFPLAIAQILFMESRDHVHFARGREVMFIDPLSQNSTATQQYFTVRKPVTKHKATPDQTNLDRAYYRRYLHNAVEIYFDHGKFNQREIFKWAAEAVASELDLIHRVKLPDHDYNRSDLLQINASRVELTQEMQKGLFSGLKMFVPPPETRYETTAFLKLFNRSPSGTLLNQNNASSRSSNALPTSSGIPAQATARIRPGRNPKRPLEPAPEVIELSSDSSDVEIQERSTSLQPPRRANANAWQWNQLNFLVPSIVPSPSNNAQPALSSSVQPKNNNNDNTSSSAEAQAQRSQPAGTSTLRYTTGTTRRGPFV